MSFLLRVYSDFHGSKPITAQHPAGKGSSVFVRVTWSRLLPTTSSKTIKTYQKEQNGSKSMKNMKNQSKTIKTDENQ